MSSLCFPDIEIIGMPTMSGFNILKNYFSVKYTYIRHAKKIVPSLSSLSFEVIFALPFPRLFLPGSNVWYACVLPSQGIQMPLHTRLEG